MVHLSSSLTSTLAIYNLPLASRLTNIQTTKLNEIEPNLEFEKTIPSEYKYVLSILESQISVPRRAEGEDAKYYDLIFSTKVRF
jgi:hypothetical protein